MRQSKTEHSPSIRSVAILAKSPGSLSLRGFASAPHHATGVRVRGLPVRIEDLLT